MLYSLMRLYCVCVCVYSLVYLLKALTIQENVSSLMVGRLIIFFSVPKA